MSFAPITLTDICQVVLLLMVVVNWLSTRKNAQGIHEIHLATNSMKDALVKATGDLKLAEGIKIGTDAANAVR